MWKQVIAKHGLYARLALDLGLSMVLFNDGFEDRRSLECSILRVNVSFSFPVIH